MLWYTPSTRTRVPSFGQTFPNKVGPCQNCLFRQLRQLSAPTERCPMVMRVRGRGFILMGQMGYELASPLDAP
jgi:hypothetical protein